ERRLHRDRTRPAIPARTPASRGHPTGDPGPKPPCRDSMMPAPFRPATLSSSLTLRANPAPPRPPRPSTRQARPRRNAEAAPASTLTQSVVTASPSPRGVNKRHRPSFSLLLADRLRRHEDHRVRLVEPTVRVVRPILAVEVNAEGPVVLVAEGRVIAERPAVRVDVGHVTAVVAVVTGPSHEVAGTTPDRW